MLKIVQKINDNQYINILLVFITSIALNSLVAPGGNELVYLSQALRFWDSNFLAFDWMHQGQTPVQFMYNLVVGGFLTFLPMSTVALVGRFVAWWVIIGALFKIGRNLGLFNIAITVALIFWLIYGQSSVAYSFMVGGFEPKSFGYSLLLFSLIGFMKEKTSLPAFLLGLSFSFHPSVGLWGGLAVMPVLLFGQMDVKRFLKIAGFAILGALPCLVAVVPFMLNAAPNAEGVKFYILYRIPHHADPSYFAKSDLVLMLALFLFNWLHGRSLKVKSSFIFWDRFQLFLLLIFIAGMILGFAGHYGFLKLLPFRLFPVFSLLMFFFHLAYALQNGMAFQMKQPMAIAAVLALLTLGNPVANALYRVQWALNLQFKKESDYQTAMKWINKNTSQETVVLSPPRERGSYYWSNRAQVVHWWNLRYDRLNEWQERIEALIGKVNAVADASPAKMDENYHKLVFEDITTIVTKYGATVMVSRTDYDYPLLFQSKSYKVYDLTGDDGFDQGRGD